MAERNAVTVMAPAASPPAAASSTSSPAGAAAGAAASGGAGASSPCRCTSRLTARLPAVCCSDRISACAGLPAPGPASRLVAARLRSSSRSPRSRPAPSATGPSLRAAPAAVNVTGSGGLPELDPVALRIGHPAEPADSLHVLRLLRHVRALGAQLCEHRLQVADPE